jgi:hypothetical protein
MKLEFAFLADAATMQPDGTFAVVAGGFDCFRAKEFPSPKPVVVFIARLLFDPEECSKQHAFVGEILDHERKLIFPALGGDFIAPPHPRHPERGNWMSLCLTFQGVVFPVPGDYCFRLSVDGRPVGHVIIEAAVEKETK